MCLRVESSNVMNTTRSAVGIHHRTVVPENFDPDAPDGRRRDGS